MMTLPAILCSALSVSMICSASLAGAVSAADTVVPVSAQAGTNWSCTDGACELRWTPSQGYTSPQSCVTDEMHFFVEQIENATSGVNAGSFCFEGQLVSDTPDVQTLSSFHSESLNRGYLRNMVFTVTAPASVGDIAVTFADAQGRDLGQKTQDGVGKIVVFWADDAAQSHGTDQTIQFEIRGSAIAGGVEKPRVWVHVAGTRCDVL